MNIESAENLGAILERLAAKMRKTAAEAAAEKKVYADVCKKLPPFNRPADEQEEAHVNTLIASIFKGLASVAYSVAPKAAQYKKLGSPILDAAAQHGDDYAEHVIGLVESHGQTMSVSLLLGCVSECLGNTANVSLDRIAEKAKLGVRLKSIDYAEVDPAPEYGPYFRELLNAGLHAYIVQWKALSGIEGR